MLNYIAVPKLDLPPVLNEFVAGEHNNECWIGERKLRTPRRIIGTWGLVALSLPLLQGPEGYMSYRLGLSCTIISEY